MKTFREILRDQKLLVEGEDLKPSIAFRSKDKQTRKEFSLVDRFAGPNEKSARRQAPHQYEITIQIEKNDGASVSGIRRSIQRKKFDDEKKALAAWDKTIKAHKKKGWTEI
jgi:hypothetical protein